MAKKKETKKVELKEVSRVEINGNIIITYEDGSVKIIPAPIMLTADQASEIFGSEEEDVQGEDEEEEEESDDDEDEEESEDDEDEDDENYKELSNTELFEKLITYLKDNKVNVYFYLTPYNPITYDILVSKEKYKIIDEVEIYVKEFAKQNNIKVVGSYDPHKLNLKNEHFFDGMHSLDIAYEIIFKDLFK